MLRKLTGTRTVARHLRLQQRPSPPEIDFKGPQKLFYKSNWASESASTTSYLRRGRHRASGKTHRPPTWPIALAVRRRRGISPCHLRPALVSETNIKHRPHLAVFRNGRGDQSQIPDPTNEMTSIPRYCHTPQKPKTLTYLTTKWNKWRRIDPYCLS